MNVKFRVLRQNQVPRNLGALQHTCTVAQRNSLRVWLSCHVTSSPHGPLSRHTSFTSPCGGTQTAYFAVNMRKKIIYNWCQKKKKKDTFIFLSLLFFFFFFKCDCCQKELSTTTPCSVLVAFKGIARRA